MKRTLTVLAASLCIGSFGLIGETQASSCTGEGSQCVCAGEFTGESAGEFTGEGTGECTGEGTGEFTGE